jgi:hypothetical protein
MLTAYRTTISLEQIDSMNLFLLHTFQIQNAYTTETCEISEDKKYFSTTAQPPSALPVN